MKLLPLLLIFCIIALIILNKVMYLIKRKPYFKCGRCGKNIYNRAVIKENGIVICNKCFNR